MKLSYLAALLFVGSLSACASNQREGMTDSLKMEIDRLAKSDQERLAMEKFATEHPDMADGNMDMYITSYRQAQQRARALEIQFRHQYPKATQEELDVLVSDQMNREGPPGATFGSPPMVPMTVPQ
jgi:hypothetical protein